MGCGEGRMGAKKRGRGGSNIVSGLVRPCNSIFFENQLLYKLIHVATCRKLDFVLSKLQISI